MWAMLDYDSNKVIAVYTPDIPYDAALKEANGRTLIKMTIENSPGYINGTYVDGKFYPPEGVTNG